MTLSLPFAAAIAVQRYLPAEDGAVQAHKEGCSHWYIDLSMETDMPQTWSARRHCELRALASDLGVSPILHGNFRAPLATEIPEVRDGVQRYLTTELALAEQLGGPLIVHGGCTVDPRPTDSARRAAMERFLSIVEELITAAKNRGVDIWVENLSHYPRHRPFSYVFTGYRDFLTARTAIPELCFVFDIGHAHVNQEFPVAILGEVCESIRAFSMSSNDGRADSHLGIHLGTAPIADLIRVIKDYQWHGTIAFETRGTAVAQGVDTLLAMWNRS